MSFGSFGKVATPAVAEVKDVEVGDMPDDSISCIKFNPATDILAVASWNSEVRLYDVSPAGESRPRAMYKHTGPVLDLSWSKDGTKLYSGGADKALRQFDVTTSQMTQIGEHAAPISSVRWFESPQGAIVASGGWDKQLKYWVPANATTTPPTPVGSIELPERCYTVDVAYPLLVVGTAERHIVIIDLRVNPFKIFETIQSPLKWQTRVIACFPPGASDRPGFAIGTIEGRIAIQYIEEKDKSLNFSFKCHRKETTAAKDNVNVFAVNHVCFHHEHGTFLTCGADGTISSWDKDSKTRLKSFDNLPGPPVVSASYNHTGTIMAYAVAYDWGKGHAGMTAGHANKVFLHPCKEDEVKRRPKK